MRSPFLLLQKNFCQSGFWYVDACARLADITILTKHAGEVAAGEENCSRTLRPGDARFFPVMQRRQRDSRQCARTAEACLALGAVNSAEAWAESASAQPGIRIDVALYFHAYKYWTTNAWFPAMILYVQKRSFALSSRIYIDYEKNKRCPIIGQVKN